MSFETLYVVFALDEFLRHYERRTKATAWDPAIAQARNFQATIFNLVEQIVTPWQFASFKKWIDPYFISPIRFPQYVDYLNGEWVELEREEREKKFNIFAKRIAQMTSDYERQ